MNPQSAGPQPQLPQRHLSDDDLIARLYGLDADPDAHLESCEECTGRWEIVQDRRTIVAAPAAAPAAVLAAQRRQVLARAEAPTAWRRAWVPALAAALLIAAGLAFYQPGEPATPASSSVAVDAVDAAWYDDVYSAQPVEPRAASPLRALFEEELETE